MKTSALRRWLVTRAYSPEQTTRKTGGYDFILTILIQCLKYVLLYYSKFSKNLYMASFSLDEKF